MPSHPQNHAWRTASKIASAAGVTCTCSLALMLASPLQVLAQAYLEDQSGVERIATAGRIGSLSERYIAARCESLKSGTEMSSDLIALKSQISKSLTALTIGDEELGIGKPENRIQTIQAVEVLNSHLVPLLAATGKPTSESVSQIAEVSPQIQEAVSRLVLELSGQYADPTYLTQANALQIDIVGRQRIALSQVRKASCFVSQNIQ